MQTNLRLIVSILTRAELSSPTYIQKIYTKVQPFHHLPLFLKADKPQSCFFIVLNKLIDFHRITPLDYNFIEYAERMYKKENLVFFPKLGDYHNLVVITGRER